MIFAGYPRFSLQTTHVLRVHNVTSIHELPQVKPTENDNAIYEQHLTYSAHDVSSDGLLNIRPTGVCEIWIFVPCNSFPFVAPPVVDSHKGSSWPVVEESTNYPFLASAQTNYLMHQRPPHHHHHQRPPLSSPPKCITINIVHHHQHYHYHNHHQYHQY